MRIAVSQFSPGDDPVANASALVEAAAAAARDGADLLLAPEGSIVSFLTDPAAPGRAAQPLDGPFVAALAQASADHGIVIAAGTFVPDPESTRVHNTLVVVEHGEVVAAYRKIHLYDAFSFVESDHVAPGTQTPPIVEINGVTVGFATCYDLRFPEVFRVLQTGGAQVLALASAWVRGPLKEEHWLTLLRARAIENTCYVVASDQAGRAGIGRSAAFDPFGLQMLDLGTADQGCGIVDISLDRVAEVRRILPSAQHTRFRVDPVPRGPMPLPDPLPTAATRPTPTPLTTPTPTGSPSKDLYPAYQGG
ncbi:carbon-nitrogen hydrolase family protein [Nakamurella sp. PAMC28650]|uniref:carbon-nitrogen hydrolase family protein n=1 Tax=Nakamurella sp. PAMC28650 TaxID=2762325 RepID=UPI00164DB70E|nr:carbon-nitrogen hydrolase family protein [Nakamurella sp. PAMC28650]QNK82218.1 carbon-nitrogen hydrolase family protein [Nakamurella sp. PAMC28650]